MRRIALTALVFGAHVASAQPIDPANPRVRSLTATKAIATVTGNLGFVDAGSGIVGGVSMNNNNMAFSGGLDAGCGLFNGQLQARGAILADKNVTFGTGAIAPTVASIYSASAATLIFATSGVAAWSIAGGAQDLVASNTGSTIQTTYHRTYNGGTYGFQTGFFDALVAPTVTACTSPTITWSNGTTAFEFDVGGTCAGISTAVITLPVEANGWECKCTNKTAPATRVIDSSAWSTTTVTVTNYSRTLGTAADFTDGADIRCICRGG